MGYVEEVCIVALLSAYICSSDAQQTTPYNISVMIPKFTDSEVATVVCKVNNSELNDVNCPNSVLPITRLKIILSNDSSSTPLLTGTDMCVFSSFLTCSRGSPVSALECGCYHDGGDIYTVNVTVRADRAQHENKTIDCRPNCINENSQYGLMNTVTGEPIVFETPIITEIVTKPTSSESTTAAPECNSSTANCNESDKCPVWCIVVAVCVPCGVCGITITVVIIIKKKKRGCSCIVESSEGGCNGTKPACSVESSEGGCNGTKPTVQDTKEMEDKTKHHGTENRPKNAQGGSNQTEESAQDTKEMQDKTKHLGTENSAYL